MNDDWGLKSFPTVPWTILNRYSSITKLELVWTTLDQSDHRLKRLPDPPGPNRRSARISDPLRAQATVILEKLVDFHLVLKRNYANDAFASVSQCSSIMQYVKTPKLRHLHISVDFDQVPSVVERNLISALELGKYNSLETFELCIGVHINTARIRYYWVCPVSVLICADELKTDQNSLYHP